MSARRPVILERWTETAPGAFQFVDDASGAVIQSGLAVTLMDVSGMRKPIAAPPNASGYYTVVKAPEGDYDVSVFDHEDRFLPGAFRARLPFQVRRDAPGPPAWRLRLYSSPARAVPQGWSVIYTELFDVTAKTPAAWALCEAALENRMIARGVSDHLGRTALLFPTPAPLSASDPSPSGNRLRTPPISEGVWPVSLQVFYRPRSADELPALPGITNQPAATIWSDVERTTPLGPQILRFGQPLVAATRGRESESKLWIEPAAQSPL